MNAADYNLTYPFEGAAVRALPLGATVSLRGIVYTGRDRLHRFLFDGGKAPVDLRNAAIFHCGPVVLPEEGGRGGWRVMAAGPTTSSREDPYMPAIISHHGVRAILGKGGMGPATQAACREYGCVYVQVVGGAAAWVARHVRRVGRVWFLEEFGATEAMWELEVEGLTGIVAMDARGASLFASVEQSSQVVLRRLLHTGAKVEAI
ncbi:MAG: fumarate hydratase C-terminal domain-containing protein [Kiritimatiellae bacterium]|nr:fumarate hydratase C-terminal domain-containing protein [Kiritimatiellia bacterium]